jgi:hypothetical protein
MAVPNGEGDQRSVRGYRCLMTTNHANARKRQDDVVTPMPAVGPRGGYPGSLGSAAHTSRKK